MSIKQMIQNTLKPGTLPYQFASIVYGRLLRPDLAWKNYNIEKGRKKCYKEFDKNRLVHLIICNMDCYYEAISPKITGTSRYKIMKNTRNLISILKKVILSWILEHMLVRGLLHTLNMLKTMDSYMLLNQKRLVLKLQKEIYR